MLQSDRSEDMNSYCTSSIFSAIRLPIYRHAGVDGDHYETIQNNNPTPLVIFPLAGSGFNPQPVPEPS